MREQLVQKTLRRFNIELRRLEFWHPHMQPIVLHVEQIVLWLIGDCAQRRQ